MTDEFELAFGNFLEQEKYDAAEQALFDLTRAAFEAGWKAAGGELPQPAPVFTLLPPKEP